MNTLINALATNGLKYLLLIAAGGLVLWVGGCPPKAPSLVDPTHSLTREELVIEIDHLLDQYEHNIATIEQQERLRKTIVKSTLGFVAAGTYTPLSVVTFIGALYGAGSAVKDGAGSVKRRRERNRTAES